MRYVPALRLAPGLSDAQRLGVVGMHLNGELLVGKKKFQQKRKTFGVPCSLAHQFALVLLTDMRQRLTAQGPVGNLALVARKPGLTNLLLKSVIRIDWR